MLWVIGARLRASSKLSVQFQGFRFRIQDSGFRVVLMSVVPNINIQKCLIRFCSLFFNMQLVVAGEGTLQNNCETAFAIIGINIAENDHCEVYPECPLDQKISIFASEFRS